MELTVAVIVTTYGSRAEHALKCADSFRRQLALYAHPLPYRLVIHGTALTPSSRHTLMHHENYILGEEQASLARAVNAGIRFFRDDPAVHYFFHLHDDTETRGSWAREACAALLCHGCVYAGGFWGVSRAMLEEVGLLDEDYLGRAREASWDWRWRFLKHQGHEPLSRTARLSQELTHAGRGTWPEAFTETAEMSRHNIVRGDKKWGDDRWRTFT